MEISEIRGERKNPFNLCNLWQEKKLVPIRVIATPVRYRSSRGKKIKI